MPHIAKAKIITTAKDAIDNAIRGSKGAKLPGPVDEFVHGKDVRGGSLNPNASRGSNYGGLGYASSDYAAKQQAGDPKKDGIKSTSYYGGNDPGYHADAAALLIPLVVGMMWLTSLLIKEKPKFDSQLSPDKTISLIYTLILLLVIYSIFLLLLFIKNRIKNKSKPKKSKK